MYNAGIVKKSIDILACWVFQLCFVFLSYCVQFLCVLYAGKFTACTML